MLPRLEQTLEHPDLFVDRMDCKRFGQIGRNGKYCAFFGRRSRLSTRLNQLQINAFNRLTIFTSREPRHGGKKRITSSAQLNPLQDFIKSAHERQFSPTTEGKKGRRQADWRCIILIWLYCTRLTFYPDESAQGMLLLVFGWARLSILFSKRIDFLPEDSRLVNARQLSKVSTEF